MTLLLGLLRWIVVGAGLFLAGGTFLNLSRNSHWFIRAWDFPRGQIAGLLLIFGALYGVLFFDGGAFDWFFVGLLFAAVLRQAWKIMPYTVPYPNEVKRAATPTPDCTIRLLISNVLQENDRHDALLKRIEENDPDLVFVVEVDETWLAALAPLEEKYPHGVRRPQDNFYGMALYSRLPLADVEVRFLVQDDIPSVHADVELPGGERVRFHGLHPRPPEGVNDQDSTPRDAELVIVGKEVAREAKPSIVAGDLNDVAWSHTTRLFRRISGLLDPRVGRGAYNTWNAKSRWLRFPLDHVFHSNDFTLVSLRRLEPIGSDHFPVLIELHYEPQAKPEQPEPVEKEGEQEEAAEKIQEAAEDPATKIGR